MSQKLTGREAVKALMDGKSITRHCKVRGKIVSKFVQYDIKFFYDDGTEEVKPISDITLCNNWEIVPEPMVWEAECFVDTVVYASMLTVSGNLASSNIKDAQTIVVPETFKGKRVKVRVEEIL